MTASASAGVDDHREILEVRPGATTVQEEILVVHRPAQPVDRRVGRAGEGSDVDPVDRSVPGDDEWLVALDDRNKSAAGALGFYDLRLRRQGTAVLQSLRAPYLPIRARRSRPRAGIMRARE